MARSRKPWFNRERGCWMVWWNGRKVRLVDGDNDETTQQLAADKLADLQYEARHNKPNGSEATVASVIDAYMTSAKQRLAQTTQDAHFPYLQSFAEAEGWRAVRDAAPANLGDWLAKHPEWKSDWTKNLAVRSVKTAFNWACDSARRIPENPFRGFKHPPGEPRRDVTFEEFRSILQAMKSPSHRKRPTPSARCRQVLIFLWYTGARPSEAAKLKWSDINWKNNKIVLRRHKTARSQRVKRPRVIELDEPVVRLLKRIQRLNQPGEHVFLNHRLKPWNKNSLALRVQRARKAAGVPDDAKLYGLRHEWHQIKLQVLAPPVLAAARRGTFS